MSIEICDLDGELLQEKIEDILLRIDNINIDVTTLLNKRLVKTIVIFYKLGLGIQEYQDMIKKEFFPLGYEILSSYMLDRFLSKYFRSIDDDVKILLLKSVERYPYYKYGIKDEGLNNLPYKIKFLEDAIILLEYFTSKYLGLNTLCRLIMQKEWDKIVFERWYNRTLDDEGCSEYNKYRDYVSRKIYNIIEGISGLENI